MEMNSLKVTIVLNSGEQLNGEINVKNFKRFSDFIETHTDKHIKLFNTTRTHNIKSAISKFVLIPKANISYYEPFDEQRTI